METSVIIIGLVVFGAVVWLLHKGEKRKNTLYHASAFALIALQSLYSTLVQERHIYYVVFRFLLIFGIFIYYVFLYYKAKKEKADEKTINQREQSGDGSMIDSSSEIC